MHAGGVFEEALAEASLFLEVDSPIAQTVRNADIIDNVWTSGGLSAQACPSISGSLVYSVLIISYCATPVCLQLHP